MGRKKRRSSVFRDSTTVIDIEEARQERQRKQKERQQKREKKTRKNPPRQTAAYTDSMEAEAYAEKMRAAAEYAAAVGQTGQEVEEEYSEEFRMRHDKRRMALRRRQRRRNLLICVVLAALVLLVGVQVGHIIVLKHDLYVAQKEQEEYKEEKAQLEKDLKEIDDKEKLEEQARDQMRLIKPGETLYIFPENMTKPAVIESDDDESAKEEEQEEEQER